MGVSRDLGASQANGLGSAEAPEPSGLGPTGAIPSARFTPGPWFVSGVRFRMNGGSWHRVSRYDEANKQDENIACVGFDPRTGLGLADAHLIAAAPELYAALDAILPSRLCGENWNIPDNELVPIDITFGELRAARAAIAKASAIEARRAATGNTDAVHESAAPKEDAR